MERDFEREIIPMVRHQGMALAPWNVLAGGKIRTDEEEEHRLKSGEAGKSDIVHRGKQFADMVLFRSHRRFQRLAAQREREESMQGFRSGCKGCRRKEYYCRSVDLHIL